MFRREPYQRMRPILEAFVVEHLRDTGFALGGATRIALAVYARGPLPFFSRRSR